MAGGSVFQVGKDVELYQVVVVLSALAICLLIFEAALHHLEHHLLAHNDKYQHMLKKVYRELMILGLISFIIKILTEVGGIDGYSGIMLALQVSDLIIFILAITLVLQAINVLLLLRGYNKRTDRAELITTQDLVDGLDKPSKENLFKKDVVKHRILRHLFLRRFGLPQLFPFSKYLRRAQANNIVHMIEVEPSMWLLLLGMAWAFSAVVQILEDYDVEVRYELIETLMAFAWVLVLFHILVMLYFRFCVHRLLAIAGYNKDKRALADSLNTVADEEANAWHNEAAESALDMMNRIHAQHEEMEHERKAQRRGLLMGDEGFQLVATFFRNVFRVMCCKKRSAPRQDGVISGTPEIRLPFYSRKAWHVVVMFLTILNGFFVALLVMGAVYSFDEIYDQVGIVPVVLIPVPFILNGLFFIKTIFRDFVLISSILRIDASTLGEVVGHFSEIVELRSEFATSLLQSLKGSGHSIADLDKSLQSHDLHRTGFIDVDKLRTVLASVGFQLTRFRLNSVVKLLFELRGTSVEYAQLVQLVTLIQQEHCIEDGFHPSLQRTMTSFDDLERQDGTRSNRRHLPLLAQSSLAPEPGPSDFVYVNVSTPLGRAPGVPPFADDSVGRQPTLQRSLSRQFSGSSSRVLHGVYNLQFSLPPADSTAPSPDGETSTRSNALFNRM
ncbi:ATP-dependent RNA helicase dbp4 [Phytophthora nicotianae]|uniref:ATP-dependent RNA helicase dbp4 n=1 Tax=Phytophthora nicotianae TaxID=4792 RepID=A0A0W8DI03_PHYNI|nr:ATP-dependent RNA helicase dbp4 [Phytophthora nicotianae]